jgi:hypothetical protein
MSGFTSTVPTGTMQNQGKTYRKHMAHKNRKGVPTKSGNKRGKMKTH